MRILIVSGQAGESSWVFEAPSQHVRQWRCADDGFIVVSPPDDAHITPFVTAVLNHARAHTGPQVSMVVVDT